MGCVIQAESHTVELPLVYVLEHSSEVLEFYDQPCQIRLSYTLQLDQVPDPIEYDLPDSLFPPVSLL